MATTWIILVNWNGASDTIECLESLLRLDNDDWRVVIVDNGSTDGSQDRIAAWAEAPAPNFTAPPWEHIAGPRKRKPTFARIDGTQPLAGPQADITLIEARRNLGFAAGNNLGMRFASQDSDACYFWILNNDTVVAPNSLSIQRQRMDADAGIGMLGARLMFYADPNVVQGLAGGFHRMRARGFHLGLGLAPDNLPDQSWVEANMAYVLGASMFVRRSLVEQIGGMSEAYFLYFEELDWARRMPAGLRMAVAHNAVVWHKEGGAIGSDTRARPSDTSLYYLSAGLLRFTWLHDRMCILIAIARLLREAFGMASRGDFSGAKVLGQSMKDVSQKISRRGHYKSVEFIQSGKKFNKQEIIS